MIQFHLIFVLMLSQQGYRFKYIGSYHLESLWMLFLKNIFLDRENISDYAKTTVATVYKYGIIKSSGQVFAPQDHTTSRSYHKSGSIRCYF
jgi:hypothetical protein